MSKILLLFLAVALLGAVDAPQQDTGVIRVSSNLVAVPVSVTDTSGQPVRTLKAEDFRVEEDGRQQKIVSLGEPGKTPLDLVLLFDVSGSVRERFQFEQQAASSFLRMVVKPGDTVSVFAVDLEPRLVQPRTASLAAAIGQIMSLQPTRDATAFYETVVEGIHYASNSSTPGTRRVIIAVSDGEDNNSIEYKLHDAVRELQRTDCVFYSINPAGASIRLNRVSLRGQQGMQELAADTGEAFVPVSDSDLEKDFRQIAAELQAQYLLGFYSSDARNESGFRHIAVSIPARPELRIRARQGYYAPKG